MNAQRRQSRAALGAGLRFSLATAATTWAAMLSWRGFTDQSGRFLSALFVVAVLVAVIGAVGRWRRVPAALVITAQVVLAGAFTCLYVGDRPYPDGSFWSALGAARDAANTYTSPVPVTETVTVQPLLVVGGLIAMVLVDVCAGSLQRVPLAGLPLLTVYSVPVSLLGGGLSWWVFALTAVGFLVMLYLQEQDHLSRWGRSLDGTGDSVRRLSEAVRGSALLVGSVGMATAVLVPLAIPTLSLSVFDLGNGPGGDDDIQIENPLVDLRRDLVRGPDVDLIRIETDDPSPDHLRISALNRFTDNEWSSGDRDVPTSNVARGDLPPLEGVESPVAEVAGTYEYDVSIEDAFQSIWLPTQAPISRIDAPGDWRFDSGSMDFLRGDDDLDTAGVDYDMTAVDLTYNDRALRALDSSPSAVDEELLELPSDFDEVTNLAFDVTEDATTDFESAILLQQFFREDGGFEYSLDRVPPRVGADELLAFLDPEEGRVGYCEQFAAAMAARVAVGFLEPTQDPDGSWVYSAHDLHAWVELYFPGAGWVLFDPTPRQDVGVSTVPDYGEVAAPRPEPSAPTTSQNPEDPANRPSLTPGAEPSQAAEPTAADTGSGTGSGFPWVALVVGLLVVVGLVLLALLPRTLRTRQRTRRLAGGPELAWEELRATAIDLRLPWPEQRSPQETRILMARHLGDPETAGDHERPPTGPDVAPEAAAALARVAEQVELTRYAPRPASGPGALHDDVLLCCDALAAGVTRRVRRRARWLPRSVAERRRVVEMHPDDAGAEPELVGGRVEHI